MTTGTAISRAAFELHDASGLAYVARNAIAGRVGEVRVLVEAGPGAARMLDTVRGVLAGVPTGIRDSLDAVLVGRGEHVMEMVERGRVLHGNAVGTAGQYLGDQGIVALYRTALPRIERTLSSSLEHEIGHHVAYLDPALQRRWYAAIDADIAAAQDVAVEHQHGSRHGHRVQIGRFGVTPYGETSTGEDIAESLALYRRSTREGAVATVRDATGRRAARFEELFPGRAAAIRDSALGALFVGA